MEEVVGVPGQLPSLTSYPPESIQKNLPPAEWQACLEAWIQSLDVRLRIQDDHFAQLRPDQSSSGVPFLFSYALYGPSRLQNHLRKEILLRRHAYLLSRRYLLTVSDSNLWQTEHLIEFILRVNQLFHNISDWVTVLRQCHKVKSKELTSDLESWKVSMMKAYASPRGLLGVKRDIQRMTDLIKVYPEIGVVLMTGYDYLEILVLGFRITYIKPEDTKDLRHRLTEHLYWCFRSLMSDKMQRSSTLQDHLYQVRTDVDRPDKQAEETILSALLCSTAFMRHLKGDAKIADSKRGQDLIGSLTTYEETMRHLHPPKVRKTQRNTKAKGKGKMDDNNDMQIHRATQISQVHDLFPDLSNARVLQLLDHFNNNVEQVIAGLLEPDTLPKEHQQPSQDSVIAADMVEAYPNLAPRSAPPLPPQRRNVFDNDDFDKLKISSRQLHKGRKDLSTDLPETKDQHTKNKAAIMAALAAFDSDDDERDDTYDVADVGGSVDQSVDTDARPRPDRHVEQNAHEEILFSVWKENPQLFLRDSQTRISKVRQDLKRQTQMTDEQIEGWAIMLGKDTAQQDRLHQKYAESRSFRGAQPALAQSRWQASSAENSTDEGSGIERSHDSRRMGQAQIRGARTWQKPRGGGTAGSASDASTQAARRRKEQGRGRGGAQQRREGHARKMARGMAG